MPSQWSDRLLDRMQEGKREKYSIAVLDFETDGKLPPEVKLDLSDMLITSLVQTGKFDVVEREKIELVKKEQEQALSERFPGGLGRSLHIDPKTAPKLGKLLGVEATVFGSVTSATKTTIDKFAYDLERIEVGIDVRAANTETGKIIFSESASGASELKIVTTAGGQLVSGAVDPNGAYKTAMQEAVSRVGPKIADLFPILGVVVNVRLNQIYLDVGQQSGVKTGQKFLIFRRGKEILRPETGGHFGWEKEVVGTVMVSTIERDMSIATLATLHDPKSPMKPGDFAISNP